MRKLYILIAALPFIFGCEHEILDEIEFYVTLAEDNIYRPGEPITFNFTGNADNIVFYSDVEGHKYEYRNRYSVPTENVESAELTLKITSQYGKNRDVLDVWITDQFEGLWGDNAVKDREIIKSLTETDMSEKWTKIEFKDVEKEEVTVHYDIVGMKDNFCIAFHWHPVYDGVSAQRHYKVSGDVSLDIKGIGKSQMELSKLNFTSVMMNEKSDAYPTGTGSGTIILTDSVYDLYFKGAAADEFEYALDGWAISRPQALNKIPNDTGEVVKNTQNTLNSFTYTWEEPGTYEVVFIVSNANHTGSHQITKKMTINIIDYYNN